MASEGLNRDNLTHQHSNMYPAGTNPDMGPTQNIDVSTSPSLRSLFPIATAPQDLNVQFFSDCILSWPAVRRPSSIHIIPSHGTGNVLNAGSIFWHDNFRKTGIRIKPAANAEPSAADWNRIVLMAFPIAVAILAFPVIFGLLPPYAMADYVLFTGEVLMAGQNLTNGQYRLAMQSNCDLILYEGENPIWGANTVGQGDDCYLSLKQNGELVVRRGVHYTLWSSSSRSKKGKYALVLDGNGRLGIYGQRRWTSSNQKEPGLLDGSTVTTEYVLFSGDKLMPPRKLKYKNYELEFVRCNLVLKDDQSGRTLWQTSTDARSCFAHLEADGELTVKHKGQRLWGSNRKGSNGPYIAVLRFDGRLDVFGPLRWTHDGHHDSPSSNAFFSSKV